VTDAGLKELGGLQSLQSLDLSSTKVTDAGLMQLKGLKRLRSLYLSKTKVTDAGIHAIKEALPGLHVSREDPFDGLFAGLERFAGPRFSSPDFGLPRLAKPAGPFHWEQVPWGMLITLGVIVLVGGMAAGYNKARRSG
jgi:hypothetical protein